MNDEPTRDRNSVVKSEVHEIAHARLIRENARLLAEVKHLRELQQQLLGSASWRLTRPLRAAKRIATRLFPLYKARRCELSVLPGRNTDVVNGECCIRGQSPYFVLEPKSGHYPEGWTELRAELGGESAHQFFLLYFSQNHGSEDSGFSIHDRAWVSLECGRVCGQLLRLPEGVKALRLDPFNAQGKFSLPRIELQELGSLQLATAIFRAQVHPFLRNPRGLWVKCVKAFRLFRRGGFAALRARLMSDSFTSNYHEWVRRYDTLTDKDLAASKEYAATLRYQPKISVVMPVYNPPLEFLTSAIESVQRQTYANWELCIADDASTNPSIRVALEKFAAQDRRIKLTFRHKNGHISAASNSALELATGEYVAFLDHDDELREHALVMVVDAINRNPSGKLFYSDEDKITEDGLRYNPYFKSGWNPELFRAQNYVCHLTTIPTELVRAAGGFRIGFEGAQDWDLFLRVTDSIADPASIIHIPHVLYHWRNFHGSTAQSTAHKPYVLEAQRKSVSEHLARKGFVGAKVEILTEISQLRVRYALPRILPLVSIIIPTKDRVEYLRRCVGTILDRTTYPAYELIIVDNGSSDVEALKYLDELRQHARVKILRDNRPFNYSRLNNDAVREARGELIAFLNNDLEVIVAEWLSEMVSHAVRPEVGAVGARLLYPNNLVQHAGIILGIGGVAGHNHKGRPASDPGYFNRLILPQNLSAVTAACLLMRRDVLTKVGPLDEDALAVAFNDVDLCLRIRSAGYLIVYTPYAELYHHESISRGLEDSPEKFKRFEREVGTMKERWTEVLNDDPYYNPNLSFITEDFSFAFPPRTRFPWKENANERASRAA